MVSIVFVHGAGALPSTWHNQLKVLGNDYDCHALDVSSLDNIEVMAEKLLDEVSGTFILAGVSMGGYVALSVMRKAMDRVEKLMLLHTSARADTPEQKLARQALMAMGEDEFIRVRQDPTYYFKNVSPAHHKNKAILKELKAENLRSGFVSYARNQFACMQRQSSLDLLPQIKLPTLVTGGKDDCIIPNEMQFELFNLIPNASLIILDQCGHTPHRETPDRFNRMVRTFVECHS